MATRVGTELGNNETLIMLPEGAEIVRVVNDGKGPLDVVLLILSRNSACCVPESLLHFI